jgi:phosphotransferase system  glucose/maltose/N-acetylglucosamine-specific IIC component
MGLGIFELLIILFLIGFIPFIIAFIDILKNEFEGYNKLIWLLAVLFAPLIGSIAYFVIGKKQRKLKNP